ncbi:MAG: hypothetical protein ABEI27_11460 [Halobellus sp.]|uniref:hypothetical protein n=1 Tax=Halobellus sp. TaxID=1979212 RepID=UPI0035D4F86F
MSDSSSPSPRAVRRSLRALADGTAPRGPPVDVVDPAAVERTIAEAEAATACAQTASAYVADGRLAELDRAVDAAATDRTSENCAADLARRGRTARATLRQLRVALLDGRTDSRSSPAIGRMRD